MEIIFFLPIFSALFVLVNFISYISTGRQIILTSVIEVFTIVILPVFFIMTWDVNEKNNCCSDSAVFSPAHRIGIYTLIVLSIAAYLLSIFNKVVLAPLAELLLNAFLLLGLVMNVVLCFHLHTKEAGFLFWLFGNVPIILLFLMKLGERYTLIKAYIAENEIVVNNPLGKGALKILQLKPVFQYPILLVLLVPFLILLSLFLLLFGQKPDSLIQAFTDTYKHGFSQLDYLCDNVQCGGHFLCSVGANGHQPIVKPVRWGERNGGKIICNRQLLISNAFEDLLQEKLPQVHRAIRRCYNKVGRFIHRYYGIFQIRVVSDIVYLLMKPLEWIFLAVLYMVDTKPENRIHKQYLNREDRKLIDLKLYA